MELQEHNYEAPLLFELGQISVLTQGSGGADTDDCSSGHYTPSEE